ncbi:hypothetical protein CAPTEDRAFT_221616 [Capitella teleta]|uniref:Uncharacterized protein n=1 Tax=Capitella teleta TaxID=283909 RepID=R7V6V0_CAPTE|nr:hypothetical protein CAPTEDRAFT_221616 [Capitella teleta]|eukprot:ELU11500.1 hypothetical protein CAPTEDRAFT_221616 [Capitella teleta]
MSLEQKNGNSEWKHGLFACMDDKKVCCLACCLPCFVVGKNAEAQGENCMLHGLLACVGLPFGPLLRWRLRQDKNIKGSMLGDTLVYGTVPCCALAQEAREVNWAMPEQVNRVEAAAQEITRD